MRGLFHYSQSMPKITSEVRSGNTRTCCSITTGCSEISLGIPKQRKDQEALDTKLPFAKVTVNFDAGLSFKPPVAATWRCTKLCVAPLSTKHSNQCPLHQAANLSNRGAFSSTMFDILALLAFLRTLGMALPEHPRHRWWLGLPEKWREWLQVPGYNVVIVPWTGT